MEPERQEGESVGSGGGPLVLPRLLGERAPYQPHAAIIDAVEACVLAGAYHVCVGIEYAGADSWVCISTQGGGLDPDDRARDLRIDKLTRRTGLDGLDPVTACLYVGRVVTIAGRRPDGSLRVVRWSATSSADTSEHAGDLIALDAAGAELQEAIRSGACCVLVIEQLDAVRGCHWQDGARVQRVLRAIEESVRAGISVTLHRHLTGSRRRRAVTVTVAGRPVEPVDPFGEEEGWRVTQRRRVLPFVVGNAAHDAAATAYALVPGGPHPSDEWTASASGGSRAGFYVYTRDRLIQLGGWSRLQIPHRRVPCVRVAVDVPPLADGGFVRDLRRVQVRFPPSLTPALKAVALGAIDLATRRAYPWSSNSLDMAPGAAV